MASSVTPSVPKTPELEPVFLINLKLGGDPAPVFTNTDRNKTLSLASVVEGKISTVENKYGLELEVEGVTGFDDITTNLKDGYNELDCKLYGKTPEGAGVYITYYGVVKLTETTVAVVTGKSDTSAFEDTYVTCNPRVHFDGLVPDKYKWAIQENLYGKGRFVRDSNGVLYVQYYVYVVR
ncbi:CIC11C00000003733 [Sungouiella intermedia]|uniref:CIC11C00000003733 n=1 Tax=Sungouiella intermedia TaxID=45354 RepID=A0A1L0CXV2_9ASCO|nr:CIC11C00000003733 [[Candida] intermedia]